MTSGRPGSGGGRFVGMAETATGARGAFEPLGRFGSNPGQQGTFKPFHTAASDPVMDSLNSDENPFASGFNLDGALESEPVSEDFLGQGLGDDEPLLSGDALGEDWPSGLGDEPGLSEADTLLPGELGEETGLAEGEEALIDSAGEIDMSGGIADLGEMLAVMPGDAAEMSAPDEGEPTDALDDQHERELEAVRAEYGELVAERISAGLKAIEQQIVDEISADVAQILTPILSEQARSSSTAAFVEALRSALADANAVSIRVEGPADLLERVKKSLASGDKRLEFKTAERVDLRAQIADSSITTRLSEWAAELAGAVDERQ